MSRRTTKPGRNRSTGRREHPGSRFACPDSAGGANSGSLRPHPVADNPGFSPPDTVRVPDLALRPIGRSSADRQAGTARPPGTPRGDIRRCLPPAAGPATGPPIGSTAKSGRPVPDGPDAAKPCESTSRLLSDLSRSRRSDAEEPLPPVLDHWKTETRLHHPGDAARHRDRFRAQARHKPRIPVRLSDIAIRIVRRKRPDRDSRPGPAGTLRTGSGRHSMPSRNRRTRRREYHRRQALPPRRAPGTLFPVRPTGCPPHRTVGVMRPGSRGHREHGSRVPLDRQRSMVGHSFTENGGLPPDAPDSRIFPRRRFGPAPSGYGSRWPVRGDDPSVLRQRIERTGRRKDRIRPRCSET